MALPMHYRKPDALQPGDILVVVRELNSLDKEPPVEDLS